MEKERDYCLLIDGNKYDRNAACRRHDNAYGIHGGGSRADRRQADHALFAYMRARKDPMALPVYLVCRLCGWIFFNYRRGLWRGQLIKRLFKGYPWV